MRVVAHHVGRALSSKDVQPYAASLEENWYDSREALAEATPEDLTALGLPRRFAVELLAAVAPGGKAQGKGHEGGGQSCETRGAVPLMTASFRLLPAT